MTQIRATEIRATQIRVTQIRASQIRTTQIKAAQIRETKISSNHRELHRAIFFVPLSLSVCHLLSPLVSLSRFDLSGHTEIDLTEWLFSDFIEAKRSLDLSRGLVDGEGKRSGV